MDGLNFTETISGINARDDAIVCYKPTMITTYSAWKGDNPLNFALVLVVLQILLVVCTTRLFVFILKPFRQPRVVAEILGGLLLGPSMLGQNEAFGRIVFPLRSLLVLDIMASMGLIYLLFLVGLEMDISALKRSGEKPLFIAIAGMALPFIVSAGFSSLFHTHSHMHSISTSHQAAILFLGVALSATAFPVLTRILAELKLLNTDIGRLALSTALINDICAWVVFVIAIALTNGTSWPWVILSSIAFTAFCFYFIRPLVSWFIKDVPDGESVTDVQIFVIITGLMVSCFVTDAIGVHAIFGAYVYGLAMPNGPIGVALARKLGDFTSGILLPMFFTMSGLRTNIREIHGVSNWVGLFMVVPLAYSGKVLGTMLVCMVFEIPARDGVILGLLMNTKGLIEIIVLNVAKDHELLNEEGFAMMVVVTVVMTALIAPIVSAIYRPTRRFIPYKKRTVQGLRLDAERRILVCVHNPSNVPSIIGLLEASHPTRTSPLSLFVLHLVELTDRVSAMLIVHATRKSGDDSTAAAPRAQSDDDIISAFENFEDNADDVTVHPLTAISKYSTMHEDIGSLAEDKRVCLIIIPFHKQKTVDGDMENTNPAFRTVNQKLLERSPCSVGIFVDRGLSAWCSSSSSAFSILHVAVLFIGGQDDREALAYALRMSEKPEVFLTVAHFVPGDGAFMPTRSSEDEEYVKNEVRKRKNDEFDNIVYVEKVANNGEETVGAISKMKNGFDLFIVGKDHGDSPLTGGLRDWSECPELGCVGDLLASGDFGSTASVLVMKQCVVGGGEILKKEDDEIEREKKTDYHKVMMQHFERHTLSSRKPLF